MAKKEIERLFDQQTVLDPKSVTVTQSKPVSKTALDQVSSNPTE